jgi:hypothetical protein
MNVLPKANYRKMRCATPRHQKTKELAPIKEQSKKRAISRNRRNSLNINQIPKKQKLPEEKSVF